MNIAILDLGTNTFHILVAEISGAEAKVLHRESTFVKIGKGGISNGFITEEAQQRALNALLHFRSVAEEFSVSHSFATATSAIRSAKNGADFLEKVRTETGFSPQVISGEKEAEWIYRGISGQVEMEKGNNALIMDIGGGSVEFILADHSAILWKQSFEIGAQRLCDQFFQEDPISPSSIIQLESFAENQLQPLWEACQKHSPRFLIGSAGTFDTLRDMATATQTAHSQEVYLLSASAYSDLHHQLLVNDSTQRLTIPGMIPERVEMIVVASALLNYVMKRLRLRLIKISAASLKEGVLDRVVAGEIIPFPFPIKS